MPMRINLTININHRVNKNVSPLYTAIDNNNTEMVKMLIDYAEDHNIILNINEKIESDSIVDTSLLMALRK